MHSQGTAAEAETNMRSVTATAAGVLSSAVSSVFSKIDVNRGGISFAFGKFGFPSRT